MLHFFLKISESIFSFGIVFFLHNELLHFANIVKFVHLRAATRVIHVNGVVWLRIEGAEGVSCAVNNVAHFLLGRVSQLQVHTVGTGAKFTLQKFFDLHNGHRQVETDLGKSHLHVRMSRV